MDLMDIEQALYTPPAASVPASVPPVSYDDHRGTETPLIIDNGSTTLRYGFSVSDGPFSGPNVIAKYKERRLNKPVLLFGDAVDLESASKAQAKTPWEGDVLLNFDALESALDHAFVHLGIDEEAVPHPVLVTERLCSPAHSRALTSELMFELYSVPSLAYCVDAVMSFYQNNLPAANAAFGAEGLILSFNTASTCIIPMLHGKGVLSHAQRIPWGASQATEYLLKLVQLKYPTFPSRLSSAHANWMLKTFCEFSPDYLQWLRQLRDPARLRSSDIMRIIQFPYAVAGVEEKTEEELAQITERRREQGRKLQELAAKTRMEKLVKKESDLQYLLELRDRREQESKKDWSNTLSAEGFDDDASFERTIKKLETDIRKARKKDVADAGEEPEEEPSFPLVDVPDADLDEEGIKEKRRQKLMKAGYDARMRVKREKELAREERLADERREKDEREQDLDGWSTKLRREHSAILGKMKDRARRKVDLTDRKSAAAQARMKSIANLAAEEKSGKKRRKGGGEDMFGADDADWAIYRKINAHVESSDEEDDLMRLQEVEAKLLEFDPFFTDEHTHAALSSQRSALIDAYKPTYDETDLAGKNRIHLNTERWRVPEAWFSPAMAGVDSAGIGEVLQNVLARFSDSEKGRLVKNVFVTGAPTYLPNLIEKLQANMRPILPPEMPIEIVRAFNPADDAWKGMAAFARQRPDELATVSVTREEYDEWGGERIKRWWGGNS